MSPEEKDKATLQKREMEIRRLLRQMDLDQLNNSKVYKNLGQELNAIQQELTIYDGNGPKH